MRYDAAMRLGIDDPICLTSLPMNPTDSEVESVQREDRDARVPKATSEVRMNARDLVTSGSLTVASTDAVARTAEAKPAWRSAVVEAGV